MVASPAQAAPSDFLTISDASGWEGQTLRFKLTYTGAGPGTFDIDLDAPGTGTTATLATDFPATPLASPYFTGTSPATTGEITFGAAGTAYVDVAVSGGTDTTDETFQLRATPDPAVGPVVTGTGTIWMVPGAPPEVTLTGPSTVAESAGNVTVTANLDGAAPHAITVPVTTLDSAAHATATALSTGGANRDYTALPADSTITIPAGQLSGTITVPLNDDNVYEGETQYFRVESTTGTIPGAAAGTPSVEIGITDNDTIPAISVEEAPAVLEGANATFPVRLSTLSEKPVTANLTPSNGTDTAAAHGAVGPGDFVTTAVPVTIPPFNQSRNVPVATETDSVVEGTETFKATLSGAVGATLGTPLTATGTITDGTTAPTLSAAPASDIAGHPLNFAEGNSGARSTFVTVTGTVPASAADREVPVVIDYKFVDGTATNGVDYRGSSGTLTIPVSQTSTFSAQIPVTIIGDTTYEGPVGYGNGETFRVVLSTPNNTIGSASLTSYGDTTFFINEDADDVLPTWTTQDVAVTEGNSGQTMARVPIKLSGPTSVDVTFNATFPGGLATATEGGVNDGATSGANDYDLPATSSVTIPAGSTIGYLDMPVNGDTVYERAETFNVAFAAGTNGSYVDSAPSNTLKTSSIVTIANDDDEPRMTFNEASGTEGTSLQIRGTIVGVSEYPYTLKFTYAGNGTPPNAATVTDDFDPATIANVNVTQGQTGAITTPLATVFLSPDSIDEPTEAFGVTATEVTPVPTGFTTSTGVYRITDDPGDLPPAASIRDETIGEDEGSVDVHVDLAFVNETTQTTQTVTIPYWTEPGSAKPNEDYKSVSGTLSVEPGTMMKTINVPIIKDNRPEGAETFTVRLGTPGPLGATVTDAAGTVMILANGGTPGGGEPGGEEPGDAPKPTINTKPTRATGPSTVEVSGMVAPNAQVEVYAGAVGSGALKQTRTIDADEDGYYWFEQQISQGYRFATVSQGKRSNEAVVYMNQKPTFVISLSTRGQLNLGVKGNPSGAGQTAAIQVLRNGSWVTIRSGKTGADGVYRTGPKFASGSKVVLRAWVSGEPGRGTLPNWTALQQVTVR